MRNRYKRLSLEFWQKERPELRLQGEADYMKATYPEIPPFFNKDGYYFDSIANKCWFEVGGRAFSVSNPEDFRYLLRLLDHRPMREKVYKALMEVKREGELSKGLLKKLQTEKEWRELRSLRWDAKKSLLRMFNRVRAQPNTD